MIKGSVYEEGSHRSGCFQYMKPKSDRKKSITIFGNFSTSHSVIDRMTKQKNQCNCKRSKQHCRLP